MRTPSPGGRIRPGGFVLISLPNKEYAQFWAGESRAYNGGAHMLQFDSISLIGKKLTDYVTTGDQKGQLAYVGNDIYPGKSSVQGYFTLCYNEGLAPDGITVVNSPTFAIDGAQWSRVVGTNENFVNQLYWCVDPQNTSGVANDENSGFAPTYAGATAVPLISMQELNRRLSGWEKDVPLNIHFLSSPGSGTWTILTSLSGFTGTQNYVTICGETSPVPGTYSITGYQPAVPASNTERSMTISGAGIQPAWIGLMAITADGSKSGVITRQLAPDVFALGPVRSDRQLSDGSILIDDVTSFSIGDVVTISDFTTMPLWPIPAPVAFPLCWHFRFSAQEAGVYPISSLGMDGSATAVQCFFGLRTGIEQVSWLGGIGEDGGGFSVIGGRVGSGTAFVSGQISFVDVCVPASGGAIDLANTSLFIHSELNCTNDGLSSPSESFRASIGGTIVQCSDVTSIASWDNGSCFVIAGQSHNGAPGNFYADPGLVWYGVNPNIGWGLLLVGWGSRNRVPYDPAKFTVTYGSSDPPITVRTGPGYPSGELRYQFADIPICQAFEGTCIASG